MDCPSCPEPTGTRIVRTRHLPGGTDERTRRCERHGHQFVTHERQRGFSLDEIRIRPAHPVRGDHSEPKNFSTDRLLRDLRKGVIGRLSEEQLREIVSATTAMLLGEVIPRKARVIKSSDHGHSKKTRERTVLAAILDTDVRDAVEDQLKIHNYRVSFVLYALAVRGRTDRPGGSGFADAEAVILWLARTFKLEPTSIKDVKPRLAAKTWQPKAPAQEALPSIVVKRDGSLATFDYERFLGSIDGALAGRANAFKTGKFIAWWVLTLLAGQKHVHSTQLAVGVGDCLRRVDEVSYLRWAIVFKNYAQVRDLYAEAVALITHPSGPLIFDEVLEPLPVDSL